MRTVILADAAPPNTEWADDPNVAAVNPDRVLYIRAMDDDPGHHTPRSELVFAQGVSLVVVGSVDELCAELGP